MDGSLASRIQAANSSLIAAGEVQAIPDFFTPDYVAHLTEQDMTGGHVWVRRFLEMLRGAFPDVGVHVEILLEGHDRVAWQRTLRGTHLADFMGVPPSGRQLVWRDMLVSRFEDALIAEEWVISDLAERMMIG